MIAKINLYCILNFKISKCMMSQLALQTITIHILPNISESKANQKMKFGNRKQQGKYFSSKVMQKMRQGD